MSKTKQITGPVYCKDCKNKKSRLFQKWGNWRCKAFVMDNVVTGKQSFIRCLVARHEQDYSKGQCMKFKPIVKGER